MGEVCQLFSAARWIDRWEALRGYILVGEGPFGAAGERVPAMCEMIPQLEHRPPHERNRIDVLRKQVNRSEARLQVIDFLARRATTRGL